MDEVTGDGHAELLDDGSIEITFAYHTATRPYSKRRGILLQQLASVMGLDRSIPFCVVQLQGVGARPPPDGV
ncbi:hypothetical protein MES5069_440003 [Mesorhizobium escarrei]|uniref:Uncharacterized protein n=1 Tax=Mesorhizobium escarrei TaxID=666018 RepID=A0ABM9E780_9HYPH|nr:hypothetical protein MES5069_440003 [Mesorhizobium escarrei]